MLDWEVPVSVVVINDLANVSFNLWGTEFKGGFHLLKDEWVDSKDFPHYITDSQSVWQWIAMQLHGKLCLH